MSRLDGHLGVLHLQGPDQHCQEAVLDSQQRVRDHIRWEDRGRPVRGRGGRAADQVQLYRALGARSDGEGPDVWYVALATCFATRSNR